MIVEKSVSRSPMKIRNIFITAIVVCCIILSSQTVSCAPDQVFGKLIICREVDNTTFEPGEECDNFDIKADQIFAAVEVSGVKAEDKWRFTWKNLGTGEVIADSANVYSTQTTGYIEGFFSNKLVPSGNGNIIAEPGDYSVSFYHNGELKATGEFKINKPSVEILEVSFSRDIDEQGNPVESSEAFLQKDTIYATVKVNYKIKGDKFGIKWFNSEDDYLEGVDFTIEENLYMPGYLVFKLINRDQKPLVIDKYKVELFYQDNVSGHYYFEVVAEEFSEAIFDDGLAYQNQDFSFQLDYPDQWTFSEEEIESGLKVQFDPEAEEKIMTIRVWPLKGNYSPEEEEYSDFADKLLYEHIDNKEEDEIEKEENQLSVGEFETHEVKYTYRKEDDSDWCIAFYFIKFDDMLYLFMRYSNLDYLDYAQKMLDRMIGSLKFEDLE